MSSRIRAHIRGNVVGYVAVFIALSGTAYAVDKVGSKDIKKGAVKSKHVKNGTLLAVDFAPGQLTTGTQGPQGAPGTPGAVSFFNLAACPSGWTELTAARGRYIVGLPVGGTLAGTAGTALTNLQNRSVGRHTHGVTDPGHSHGVTDPGHSHFFGIDQGATDASSQVGEFQDTAEPTIFSDIDQTSLASTGITINNASTGVTINNAGTVAGTNSPYIQLLVCQKA
jgi:hypothetical protein